MSQKYVIGNWKLHPKTLKEVNTLSLALIDAIKPVSDNGCILGVAPSFVHLAEAQRLLTHNKIKIGAQDIASNTADTGAFTGDVSAAQVHDMGASFVLVGHSERRQYHHEEHDELVAKIKHAFEYGLQVVLCVGETQAEYDSKQTAEVITSQLQVIKPFGASLTKAPADALLIAYEPRWAIGTGRTPNLQEIEAVHSLIRKNLDDMGIRSPILYGGSVNDKNAAELASSDKIDGALVGGASLKAESFASIVRAFCET